MRRNGPSVAESPFTLEETPGWEPHPEEFYQVMACSLEMKKLNRELRQWERIYNTVRPHQSLGYYPATVPAAGFISEKGMKSVTNLLDEYKD